MRVQRLVASLIAGAAASFVAPIALAQEPAPPGSTAAAMPDATASPTEDQDAAYPRSTHFALRADAGAAYRTFYGIDMGLATLALGAAADTPGGSFGGGVFGAVGATEGGLDTRHVGAFAEAAWLVGDLVRLGVMPRVGVLFMDVVTTSEDASTVTGGIAFPVSVDLLRSEGFALGLGVEPAIEDLADGDGSTFSIGSFLQFRYRFPRATTASYVGSVGGY